MEIKVLAVLIGVLSSMTTEGAIDLNIIYVGSVLNSGSVTEKTDETWRAVFHAAKRVNELEGLLDGYHLSVWAGNQWNESGNNVTRMLTPVSECSHVMVFFCIG